MPETKSNSMPPPYMTAGLFRATVEAFAESTTPNALDRHILSHLSGADYSSLISSLRFLGLVSGSDNVIQNPYRALVEARKKGEPEYKGSLLSIVEPAYETIVQGVDIDRGSLPQLEKAFRDAGVPSGQMLVKTVRFYVKTMLECGKAVSPHITKQRRSTQKKANGGVPKKMIVRKKPPEVPGHTPPPLTEKTPIQVLFELLDPNAMTDEEQQAVWTLLQFIKKQESVP